MVVTVVDTVSPRPWVLYSCSDVLCSAGKVYAYEVDGLGNNRHDFDDANVPSLLAIPVLGYKYYDKKIYQNTRDRLLRFVGGVDATC